ncbi:hypothetical protein AAFF_G00078240 [Aldrovandia affinis]|uniref:Uncharacterized protein n=1 Tax=Aldrovandia affinis TaxID=143900 RepID=A0AAD7S098_9TELE|nr:hypothetical protein AAFF_G00078240 [Aldrovandia affinis]
MAGRGVSSVPPRGADIRPKLLTRQTCIPLTQQCFILGECAAGAAASRFLSQQPEGGKGVGDAAPSMTQSVFPSKIRFIQIRGVTQVRSPLESLHSPRPLLTASCPLLSRPLPLTSEDP